MATTLENIPVKYTDLISEIETGQVKIPQFQRKFVWGIKASAKLLDSIMKGYPIGTFIYWRTNERLRSIRNLGNIELPDPKHGEYINYVLDGQQRLTSLYAALKGIQIEDEEGRLLDYSEIYIDLTANEDQEIVITDIENKGEFEIIKITDLMEGDFTLLGSYPKELQKLADLKLLGFEAKVRDLFLIGAGTGQRFSDYSRYSPDNFYRTFSGVPLLSVISQKTDIPAKIPLNIFSWLIPTLEKYDYSSPKMSMQKFNETIKEVCRKAELDENVLKVDQYMGRRARVEKYYVPKYQEVASHTCRRSFATNLYRMGYKLGQIMPMTGHATEAQLREYIGIDAEENAEEIARSIEQRNRQALD